MFESVLKENNKILQQTKELIKKNSARDSMKSSL